MRAPAPDDAPAAHHATLGEPHQQLAATLWLAGCRLAGFALLNLLDDPAMLALAFC